MLSPEALRDVPSIAGRSVRLHPLGPSFLEAYRRGLDDVDVRRLTGSHAVLDLEAVEHWLRTRADHHDRADWAVLRASDGLFLGEAVLNEVDLDNGSANYRVWLAGRDAVGHGYGTEVTRLVVDYAFDQVGLHRLGLEVHDHNPRARRVYEKCGFVLEGRRREALHWEGVRHDTLVMSLLRTDPRPGR